MQQGDGLASADFCVGLHPEIKVLDAEVAVAGGAARFDMDDGYVVGPPEAVFPAVLRFSDNIRDLGLELQLEKCECYSPAGVVHSPDSRPLGMLFGNAADQRWPQRWIWNYHFLYSISLW